MIAIVPDDMAVSILSAVILFLLMTKLYPAYRKKLTDLIGAGCFAAFAFVFMLYPVLASDVHPAAYLAEKFNAYFSGVINVAGSLTMRANGKLAYFMGIL